MPQWCCTPSAPAAPCRSHTDPSCGWLPELSSASSAIRCCTFCRMDLSASSTDPLAFRSVLNISAAPASVFILMPACNIWEELISSSMGTSNSRRWASANVAASTSIVVSDLRLTNRRGLGGPCGEAASGGVPSDSLLVAFLGFGTGAEPFVEAACSFSKAACPAFRLPRPHSVLAGAASFHLARLSLYSSIDFSCRAVSSAFSSGVATCHIWPSFAPMAQNVNSLPSAFSSSSASARRAGSCMNSKYALAGLLGFWVASRASRSFMARSS
mmetsp:Transcript_117022/g.227535  ORF Transcript_117022/g.227535 Transcript_117022/m.227535 type:complete len:271 (-) Transcript_117022:573-1385(-)